MTIPPPKHIYIFEASVWVFSLVLLLRFKMVECPSVYKIEIIRGMKTLWLDRPPTRHSDPTHRNSVACCSASTQIPTSIFLNNYLNEHQFGLNSTLLLFGFILLYSFVHKSSLYVNKIIIVKQPCHHTVLTPLGVCVCVCGQTKWTWMLSS